MANFEKDVSDVLQELSSLKENRKTKEAENDERHAKRVQELVSCIEYTRDGVVAKTGVDYLLAEYRSELLEKGKKSFKFRLKLKYAKRIKVPFTSYTNVKGIDEIKRCLYNYENTKTWGGYNFIKVSDSYPLYVGLHWDSYGFVSYYLMAERSK